METCFICERTEKEVKLLDAIYGADTVKICERCAIVEDIPILRKPSTSQLKEAERSQTVYQRLKKMAGKDEKGKRIESVLDKIRKLDEHPELEKPEEKPFNLISNFNWHVQRARRNKGLSQRQLAWALGESETAIKMVEKGELPEKPEKLICKLEQFFQIIVRERTEEEIETERKRKEEKEKQARKFKIPKAEAAVEEIEAVEPIKPILEEEKLDELDIISEKPTEEARIEETVEKQKKEKPSPVQVLSFKPEIMKEITIADLKEMKKEREREDRLTATEKERKKSLQAETLIQELKSNKDKKQAVRKKVAEEMKELALGKKEELEHRKKAETIEEKKEILNKALKKVSKTEEEEKDRVPTITELFEKKREKGKEKKAEEVPSISELAEKKKEESIIGDDIEIIRENGEEG